jgi:hypothetical protein
MVGAVLAHLTPNEIPLELALLVVGFVGGLTVDRLRRGLRQRR